MADNPETPQNNLTTDPTASEKKEPGKRKEFWIGFGGSIGGNILMYAVLYGLRYGMQYILGMIIPTLENNAQFMMIITLTLLGLPWVANIVAIILLLKNKRPRIVLGILASYAIPLLVGLGFAAYCFVSLVNS